MHQKNKNPAAGGTASGAGTLAAVGSAASHSSTQGERAQIVAAALLLPRRQPGRHHLVGLRRNPRGGARSWLVRFNDTPEIAISGTKLLSVRRFRNVVEYQSDWQLRGGDDLALPLALAALPEQAVWQCLIEGLIAIIVAGTRGRA
jgi:hypothetical protein